MRGGCRKGRATIQADIPLRNDRMPVLPFYFITMNGAQAHDGTTSAADLSCFVIAPSTLS